MKSSDLQQAWHNQAQLDAEHGVIECRMCRRRAGLDETTTLWRNGVLAFALCDGCAGSHEVHFRPTARGVEVRGRRVAPLAIGGEHV